MSDSDPVWDEVRGYFVDLDGRPISMRQWADLREDLEARILAEDALPSGRLLRTMWHGHREPHGGVWPFGSAVCPPRGQRAPLGSIHEVEEYDTRQDALAGHARWLAELGAAPEGDVPDERGT